MRRVVLMMVLVRGERVGDKLTRIGLCHVRMPAATLRKGALAFENEAAPSLVEHLRRACEKLLAADFAIKTNADVAGGELAFVRHSPPWNASCPRVVEGRQE